MTDFFNTILSNNPTYSDSIINIGLPILTDILYGMNTYTILDLPNYYYTGAYQYNHNTIYYSAGNQVTALQMILQQIVVPSIFIMDLSNDTLDYSIFDTTSVRGLQSFVDPVNPSICNDFIPILEMNQNSFIVYIKNYNESFTLSNSRISSSNIINSEAYFFYDAISSTHIYLSNNQL